MASEIDRGTLARQLAAPFPPECVRWRVQGKPEKGARRQIVAYVDARAVQDRFDAVVGPLGWSFEWSPLVTTDGEIRLAKGIIQIGETFKQDVGEASNFEASKGCVSDTFKRCAVLWGVGRYLYSLPEVWVMLDEHGHIPARTLATLRARLAARFSPEIRALPDPSGRGDLASLAEDAPAALP